jgi:hypothetical protein
MRWARNRIVGWCWPRARVHAVGAQQDSGVVLAVRPGVYDDGELWLEFYMVRKDRREKMMN